MPEVRRWQAVGFRYQAGKPRFVAHENLCANNNRAIDQLRGCGIAQLGHTRGNVEILAPGIATIWRFTCNNGITEGFHARMELLQRQAYGFRNFANYRLRVTIVCSGTDRR